MATQGAMERCLDVAVRQLNTTVATLLVYAIVFIVSLTVATYVDAQVDPGWSIVIGPVIGVVLLIFILPIIAILTQVGALMLLRFASRRPGPPEIMTILVAGVIFGGGAAYAIGSIVESNVVTFGLPGAIAGAATALTLRWRRGPLIREG